MGRWIIIVAALGALASCSRKKAEGLPPAQEWTADQGAVQPPVQAPSTHGMDPNNPHAGLDMGADPNNPHAGMDMNNPHAGGAGMDVEKLGLPPPDPDRKIDPSHRIKGVIVVPANLADKAPSGGVVFLNVKRADASGQPTGAPLAVAKLTYSGGELPFELTEAQAMVAGTDLSGDVVVSARYDHDGDAISKQPGDVVGSQHVKVPADSVKITLDSVLP